MEAEFRHPRPTSGDKSAQITGTIGMEPCIFGKVESVWGGAGARVADGDKADPSVERNTGAGGGTGEDGPRDPPSRSRFWMVQRKSARSPLASQ